MKRLLMIFVFGLFISPVFAQQTDTTKVTVNKETLEALLTTVDTLQEREAELRLLVANLERQLLTRDLIAHQDSIILSYQDKRFALLEEEIRIHEKRIKSMNSSNWKNYLWYGAGAATLFISSIVVNNVEN